MKRYWETVVASVKAGDRMMVDDGFVCNDGYCIRPYRIVTIQDARPWWQRLTGNLFSLPDLYFECDEGSSGHVGKHFLDGQIDGRDGYSSGFYQKYDVYVGLLHEREGWNAIIGDLLDAYWGAGDGWPEGPPHVVQAAIEATGWHYDPNERVTVR